MIRIIQPNQKVYDTVRFTIYLIRMIWVKKNLIFEQKKIYIYIYILNLPTNSKWVNIKIKDVHRKFAV